MGNMDNTSTIDDRVQFRRLQHRLWGSLAQHPALQSMRLIAPVIIMIFSILAIALGGAAELFLVTTLSILIVGVSNLPPVIHSDWACRLVDDRILQSHQRGMDLRDEAAMVHVQIEVMKIRRHLLISFVLGLSLISVLIFTSAFSSSLDQPSRHLLILAISFLSVIMLWTTFRTAKTTEIDSDDPFTWSDLVPCLQHPLSTRLLLRTLLIEHLDPLSLETWLGQEEEWSLNNNSDVEEKVEELLWEDLPQVLGFEGNEAENVDDFPLDSRTRKRLLLAALDAQPAWQRLLSRHLSRISAGEGMKCDLEVGCSPRSTPLSLTCLLAGRYDGPLNVKISAGPSINLEISVDIFDPWDKKMPTTPLWIDISPISAPHCRSLTILITDSSGAVILNHNHLLPRIH